MRTFRITSEIDAPAERVWQVMTDIERWHEWTPSITGIRRLDAGPLAPGSRVVIRQPRLPPAKWTVTALEPGRSFTWVSVGPGLRVVARHQVAGVERAGPSDADSRATLSVELQGILASVWGRLTGGITKRYIGLEARGLKARSEDPGFRHAEKTR